MQLIGNKPSAAILIFLFLISPICIAAPLASPLPEVDVPFVKTIVPPHKTLTAHYFNASRWNYVSCVCTAGNCPLIASWKYKDEVRTVDFPVYIAVDTYNANHHGKLHIYNNSDRFDVAVYCYPEFDPPRQLKS